MKAMRALGFVAAGLLSAVAVAQELSVRPDRENGIYQAGETVKWTVEAKGDAAAMVSPTFRVKSGGLKAIQDGPLQLTGSTATIEAKADEPGWILLEVSGKNAQGKKVEGLGGAIFSPEQIKPSAPRPDDFDAFWQAKLDELAKVPVEPKLERRETKQAGIEYYYLEMNNIRGTHIRGQLAKPAKEGKFPALLVVQWAGVYPLDPNWINWRAAQGWLVLDIQAHDLPVAEPMAFYKEQEKGALQNYPKIGNEDRETSYFLRMYLSCYRAAEYLASREDWDGKVLVVTGGSQGGLQSVVTAALDPRVTAVVACVPAGCDNTGPDAGRWPGWPQWMEWNNPKEKDLAKIRETSRYYDVVNFASRVKCPTLIGTGGIDMTCPPVGVYAMYNQLACPKEMVYMPLGDHQNKHQAYDKRSEQWLDTLRKGEPAPLAK